MANEPIITVTGNLTSPPELRFTPSGSAVASFTIASTPRTFDRNSNEWKDGETLFMRCSAWREMAENICETFPEKGSAVIAQGRLKSRSYENTSGEKRTVMELEVDDIGPSLRYASAKVTRTPRNNNGGNSGFNTPSPGAQNVANQLGGQSSGGWGAPQGGQDPWGNGQQSEVPF